MSTVRALADGVVSFALQDEMGHSVAWTVLGLDRCLGSRESRVTNLALQKTLLIWIYFDESTSNAFV